jgi:hypothetical protein
MMELTLPFVPAVFLQGTQWHTAYKKGGFLLEKAADNRSRNEAGMQILTTATGSPSYS